MGSTQVRLVVTLCFGLLGSIGAQAARSETKLIDVPGSECADGTKSFITVTTRPGAKKLLVYLAGGGACWDSGTCGMGIAKPLTRVEKLPNWDTDKGIGNASDDLNPFAKDYNIVSIPYCTGDAHTGNRVANYGSSRKPYIIRHHGYANVVKSLEMAKTLFPEPTKAVMLGCSAGGIGAFYHLRNFAATYPNAPKYVISDAGTPFKPPYLMEKSYAKVMKSWGADTTLPEGMERVGKIANFAELVKYNRVSFPDIRYGLISAYGDNVMTFFAFAVGSADALKAVKRTIIDVADNYIGRDADNAHVFFTESGRHCHTPENLKDMTSERTNVGEWMTAMVGDTKEGWGNIRPDLKHEVLESSYTRSARPETDPFMGE